MKKLLLTLGAVASVAAPVAAVVACSSDDDSAQLNKDVYAAIANGTGVSFELVPANTAADNINPGTDQVGDASTNHPFRIIFTADESKTLFGDDFATNDAKTKSLMETLNKGYASFEGHGTTVQALNTPAYADVDGKPKPGWNAFFVGSRSGKSTHFGFVADTSAHVEIIANFRSAITAVNGERATSLVKSIIAGLLK